MNGRSELSLQISALYSAVLHIAAVVAREDLSVRVFWNDGDDFVSVYQNAAYPWRMFGLGHRMRG